MRCYDCIYYYITCCLWTCCRRQNNKLLRHYHPRIRRRCHSLVSACFSVLVRLLTGTISASEVCRIPLGPHAGPALHRRAHPGPWGASAFSGTWVLTWSACGCWCRLLRLWCCCPPAPSTLRPFIQTHAQRRTNQALTVGHQRGSNHS